MPLHDWNDDRGWDSVQQLWIAELVRWLRPRLPAGFRAYLGSVPLLTLETDPGRPDVTVRTWLNPATTAEETVGAAVSTSTPDLEAVATFTTDPQWAIHIARQGRLIAAIELVSPRNKDRPEARDRYRSRYVGYLRQGVHLLLVDLLPLPAGFSFASAIASDLGLTLPPCPPPFAVTLRVGEAVPEGTLLAAWRRPLQVGQPLPVLPLPLDVHQSVPVDLETTYTDAARLAYLD